jgi:hypothetical protein
MVKNICYFKQYFNENHRLSAKKLVRFCSWLTLVVSLKFSVIAFACALSRSSKYFSRYTSFELRDVTPCIRLSDQVFLTTIDLCFFFISWKLYTLLTFAFDSLAQFLFKLINAFFESNGFVEMTSNFRIHHIYATKITTSTG